MHIASAYACDSPPTQVCVAQITQNADLASVHPCFPDWSSSNPPYCGPPELRLLLPTWNIKRLTSQTASTLLITLMAIFALSGLGLQIVYFIPLFPNVPFRNFKIASHSLFAYFVWGNMVANYCLAILKHAGSRVTSETESDDTFPTSDQVQTSTEDKSLAHNKEGIGTQESGREKHRYCSKCQALILYIDHHCPFTGNCVGLNTYSHFFLTLCYGSVGLGYSLIVYFGEGIFPSIWNWLQMSFLDRDTLEAIEPFVELYFPALGGFIVINVILGFHIFLLLLDMTTFEVLTNFWKAPVFKIGYQRILNKEYLKKDSRLNVLLLSKRRSLIWFIIPSKYLVA